MPTLPRDVVLVVQVSVLRLCVNAAPPRARPRVPYPAAHALVRECPTLIASCYSCNGNACLHGSAAHAGLRLRATGAWV